MCSTCQALVTEFAEDIIRRRLRLKPGEARIVAQMWRNGIYEPNPTSNSDTVLVNRIRHKLGRETVETVKCEGYRLSPAGRSSVEAALCCEAA